ncbi:MAG: hypothetical protein GY719_28180 [bacterium]|nr:hypothetical protein [bacterium]
MYGDRPRFRQPIGMGGRSAGPPPRDVLVLLGVLFLTYSLQFFEAFQPLIEYLKLSRDIWLRGHLWQLATYPFVAEKSWPFYFLLSLLITFWFGRDVFRFLGRRQFWQVLAWGFGAGAIVAMVVQVLMDLAGAQVAAPFILLQGQGIVLTVLISAFGTVYRNATILMFFVLPLKASWFPGLYILFAFMSFLTTKDFAGFLGVCAAVGVTTQTLSGRGLGRTLREWRLRIERKVLEARLERMKKKRGMRIVKPPEDDEPSGGPWIN